MSVVPVVQGGNVQLLCDNGHSPSIPLASVVRPAAGAVGAFGVLTVTCPTCNETSSHPISGGADQANVQAMFLAAVAAAGCPCGALTAGKAAALVRSHLRQHAQQFGAGFVA